MERVASAGIVCGIWKSNSKASEKGFCSVEAVEGDEISERTWILGAGRVLEDRVDGSFSPVLARRRFVRSKSGKWSPGITFVKEIERIPEEISYFAEDESSSMTDPGRVSLYSISMLPTGVEGEGGGGGDGGRAP